MAGFWYVVLIPLGFFAVAYIPSFLLIPGDIATTVTNIADSASLFRLAMVSTILMNIVTIIIVVLLYRLLKSSGLIMALLMLTTMLFGAVISTLNELNNFAALVLSSAEATAVFTTPQIHYLVGLFLDMHKHGAHIAAIFWGIWLFPLGYLIIKGNYMPKIIGILLVVAGIGYVVDSLMLFLAPQFTITLSDYTFVGELALAFWLLIKGVNTGQIENDAALKRSAKAI